jgi:hypothetical protein
VAPIIPAGVNVKVEKESNNNAEKGEKEAF